MTNYFIIIIIILNSTASEFFSCKFAAENFGEAQIEVHCLTIWTQTFNSSFRCTVYGKDTDKVCKATNF